MWQWKKVSSTMLLLYLWIQFRELEEVESHPLCSSIDTKQSSSRNLQSEYEIIFFSPVFVLFSQFLLFISSSTRFIVVNMRRRRGDMKFNDNTESMGMLEIAGFDRNSPKVIEAFVKQQFV